MRAFHSRCRCVGGAVFARAALLFLLFTISIQAQDKNPLANDANAAKLGEFEFRANCAFCHGLGARGGGRGPDLTRAQKKHGNSDADLFRTINEGVPGTAMPQNGATQQGVGMTEEEIWQVVSYIRSVEVKTPAHAMGSAARGTSSAVSFSRTTGSPRHPSHAISRASAFAAPAASGLATMPTRVTPAPAPSGR